MNPVVDKIFRNLKKGPNPYKPRIDIPLEDGRTMQVQVFAVKIEGCILKIKTDAGSIIDYNPRTGKGSITVFKKDVEN